MGYLLLQSVKKFGFLPWQTAYTVKTRFWNKSWSLAKVFQNPQNRVYLCSENLFRSLVNVFQKRVLFQN